MINIAKRKQSSQTVIIYSMILALILILIYCLMGLNAQNYAYFLNRRVMKVVTILLVSYAIGYSSLSFQTITNNKILTPSVMGLDALYLFVQTLIVYFFTARQLAMISSVSNFFISVGVMLLFSWILFYFLFKQGKRNIYMLVLSGMIIGGLFNGLSTFMQILLDPNEFTLVQGKMFASFNNINFQLFWICAVILIITVFINMKKAKKLDVLSLGREVSINLGLDVHRFVQREFMMIALLVALSTALVGPMTFLGILIVSLTRKLIPQQKHQWMIIEVTILGVIFLMGGLILVERVFQFNTTINVMIDFFGGSYFIYLMIKER